MKTDMKLLVTVDTEGFSEDQLGAMLSGAGTETRSGRRGAVLYFRAAGESLTVTGIQGVMEETVTHGHCTIRHTSQDEEMRCQG